MSGDPFSVNHVDWLEGSAGRSSGFLAGVSAGYDQQYRVDSAYSLEAEVHGRWLDSLSKLERSTGQKYDMPMDYSSLNNYVRATQGEDPSGWAQQITLQGLDPTEALRAREPFNKANDIIKQLGDPNIRSMEDIVKQVVQERMSVEQRNANVSDTGGFMAGLGQFVGAVGGSFSERDPLLLGTLGFGGFGKTVAARIATEMGAIGAVEAVQQYGAVEPTRALLGEEPGSPLLNVGLAMAGAGLLRGGVEGLGKFVDNRRLSPQLDELELTNEMRLAFEAMPQSPSARAGLHLLDAQADFTKANPYGQSEPATRRFIAELEDVQRVMSGTETAVGRFLPEMPIDTQKLDADSLIVQAERPEIYTRLTEAQTRLAEIDERINKANEGPELLTDANGIPVKAFHGTATEFEGLPDPAMNRIPQGMTVYGFDAEVASRYAKEGAQGTGRDAVRVFPVNIKKEGIADFRNPEDLAKARQWYAEQANELAEKYPDRLAEPFSEDSLARGDWGMWENAEMLAANGWKGAYVTEFNKAKSGEVELNVAIADREAVVSIFDRTVNKDALQLLRAERKKVVKAFKIARNNFDTAVADINRVAEAKERIARLQSVGDIGSQAKLMDEPPGEILRHDNVEAMVAATATASELVDDIAAAIVRGPEIDPEAAPVVDDGMIDLGNGVRISKDFTLNLEDEAGNSLTLSADDIMRDLKDDLALEEAVRICSI